MFSESQATLQVSRAILPSWGTALPFPGGMVAVRAGAAGPCLLAAPYSSTGHAALFVIPLTPGETRKIPLDDDGVEAILAGPDGRVYLGTCRGRLLRVDVDAGTVETLGTAEDRVTTGTLAGDTFWFATAHALIALTPDGLLSVPHDLGPVTVLLALGDALLACGQSALLRLTADRTATRVSHDLADPRAVVLPDGGVLLVSGRDGRAARLSPAFDALTPLPGLPEQVGCFCLGRAGEDVLACDRTGVLHRLTPEGWEYRGVPMPCDPFTFTALPDGRLAGVTYQGRLVQTTVDWRMYALAPLATRETDGMDVTALGLGADRRLYFAPRATARVGRWDPEDDEIREPVVVSPYPGEIGAFGVAGERLYLAVSAPCAVCCYYPDLPLRLQENPKLVGQVGPGQARPVGEMVYLLGQLYFATAGEGHEGALVRIIPIQDRLAVYPGVIPGQQPTGVAADRMNHLLILGGRGTGGFPAQVACWSPDEEAVTVLAIPFPDARVAHAWGAEGGRAYITDGGDRLAILRTTDGAVLETGRFPLGTITAFLTTPYGECYGLAGGWLFHFDPVRGHVERLTEADGDHLTLVRRDYFAYTRQGRVETIRLW